MPESPRWLVLRGATRRGSISRYSCAYEADLRLEDVKQAGEHSQRVEGPGRPAVAERVPGPRLVHFFHHASGVEAVVLYSVPLVRVQEIKPAWPPTPPTTALATTVAVGVARKGFIVVGALSTDRAGDSAGDCALPLASTAIVTIALASLAQALHALATAACVVSVLTFVTAFSVGLGPTYIQREPWHGDEHGDMRPW
ncbi:hypothetical protein EJB05_09548, partial [Eragrostis curvula]